MTRPARELAAQTAPLARQRKRHRADWLKESELLVFVQQATKQNRPRKRDPEDLLQPLVSKRRAAAPQPAFSPRSTFVEYSRRIVRAPALESCCFGFAPQTKVGETSVKERSKEGSSCEVSFGARVRREDTETRQRSEHVASTKHCDDFVVALLKVAHMLAYDVVSVCSTAVRHAPLNCTTGPESSSLHSRSCHAEFLSGMCCVWRITVPSRAMPITRRCLQRSLIRHADCVQDGLRMKRSGPCSLFRVQTSDRSERGLGRERSWRCWSCWIPDRINLLDDEINERPALKEFCVESVSSFTPLLARLLVPRYQP